MCSVLRAALSLLLVILLSACGLESLLGLATGSDHPTPDGGTGPDTRPAIVTGRVPASFVPGLSALDLNFRSQGTVTPTEIAIDAGQNSFSAKLPPGQAFRGLLVEVRRKTMNLFSLIPEAIPGETRPQGSDLIGERSTAASLLILAKASARGLPVSSLSGRTLEAALLDLDARAGSGPVKVFYDMVAAVANCASCTRGSAARFAEPLVSPAGVVVKSGLDPDFILANPVDYDPGAGEEDTTEAFDAAMQQALAEFEFSLCTCDDPAFVATCCANPDLATACGPAPGRPVIRVVIAANMNAGQKDGNCDVIDRFRWAEDKPGARLFVAAGVHPESPIQDAAIHQALGAWTPNQVPMSDDGTNGDGKAGDGIWTATFVLPVGMRIGYKFSWGLQGDNWGGTEEWPGNQRLLEIADANGDGLVVRLDNFGDETTNKDKDNMLLKANGGSGTVTWDTDANQDGIPDVRERQSDSDGDCRLDAWLNPSSVSPLSVDCP
ncbi:MAG: hypothetical protein GYA21_17175 [Myxococcales bacterium]|nr:hypothetical protein [Myxococcales bacterium]